MLGLPVGWVSLIIQARVVRWPPVQRRLLPSVPTGAPVSPGRIQTCVERRGREQEHVKLTVSLSVWARCTCHKAQFHYKTPVT